LNEIFLKLIQTELETSLIPVVMNGTEISHEKKKVIKGKEKKKINKGSLIYHKRYKVKI
jgi:hypothetical protein